MAVFDAKGQKISFAYDDGTTLAAYTYDDLQRKIGERVHYGSFVRHG
jgi:hypothetical protein